MNVTLPATSCSVAVAVLQCGIVELGFGAVQVPRDPQRHLAAARSLDREHLLATAAVGGRTIVTARFEDLPGIEIRHRG